MNLIYKSGWVTKALNGFVVFITACALVACGGGDGFTGNSNVGAYVGANLSSAVRPLITTSPSVLTLEVGKTAAFTIAGGVAGYRVNSSNPLVSLATMVDATTFSVTGSTIGTSQVAVFDDAGTSVNVSVTVASSTGSTALFTTAPSSITIATGAQPSYGISGGSVPFRVVSNDVNVAAVLSFNDSEFKLQGVKGGAATVVISDSTGATKSVQVTVTPTVTLPMLVSPSAASASVGDVLFFRVSGGAPSYEVLVNNSSIASVSLSTIPNSGGSFSLKLLKAGSTTIAITDALGQTQTVTLTVASSAGSTALFTTAPSSFTIATGAQPSYGIGGGSAPFRVVSNDVSVAAVLNFNDTEFKLQGVKGGAATVVISDSTGATKLVQVTVTPTATTALQVSPTAPSASVGDVLVFRVSGGAPKYYVLVNNTSIASASTSTVSSSGGTFTLNLLKAGSTTLAITDTLGQTQTFLLTVSSAVIATPLFTTAPSSITIATGAQPSYGIGGGRAPFRVVSNDVSVAAVLSFNDAEFKLQGIKGGGSTVVISDSTGATKSVQVNVTPTATTPMLVSPSTASASVGDVLVFKVSGGEPGYGVQVNNSSIASPSSSAVSTSGGTFSLNLIKAGTTTITITDGLGQTQTVTLTIGSPPLFTTAPGNITIATGAQPSYGIGGGTAPYTVVSSDVSVVKLDNDREFKLEGVNAGVATVVVSDSTGATKSVLVTVASTVTTPMLLSPSAASASIGDALVFKVSGGKHGYNVVVNNTSIASASTSTVSTNGGTFSLNLLKMGSTTIAITDALGQTQTVTLTVDASDAKLRLAPRALTIDENFKDGIAFSIYGGAPGTIYTVYTSDQLLFSTPLPFSNSSTSTFLLGVGTAGNRCILPNNVAPATITGIYDVQITVIDQSGASAVSVVSIRDNARGCS